MIDLKIITANYIFCKYKLNIKINLFNLSSQQKNKQ